MIVLAALLSFLQMLSLPVDAQWTVLEETFTRNCPPGQGITSISISKSSGASDSTYNFGCGVIGAGVEWYSYWTAAAAPNQLSCGDNEYLSLVHSNGTLLDLRGVTSSYNPGEEQLFLVQTLEIYITILVIAQKLKSSLKFECNRNTGYLPFGDRQCERQSCGPLTIANGQTSPTNCLGNFGDVCKYESCNTGYKFSMFGSTTRKCDWLGSDARWDGMERLCEDIDECSTGTDNCFPGSICKNTLGSYLCNCAFGDLSEEGDSCIVESPTSNVQVHLRSITVFVSGVWTNTFPKYELSVARWSHDLSSKENVRGFPKVISSSFTGYNVEDLEPGTRYRVTVYPLDRKDDRL
eukprot:gene8789-1164_t